jgi:hypothetical protein
MQIARERLLEEVWIANYHLEAVRKQMAIHNYYFQLMNPAASNHIPYYWQYIEH